MQVASNSTDFTGGSISSTGISTNVAYYNIALMTGTCSAPKESYSKSTGKSKGNSPRPTRNFPRICGSRKNGVLTKEYRKLKTK